MKTTEQILDEVMIATRPQGRKPSGERKPFVADIVQFPLANLTREERKALNAIRAGQDAMESALIAELNPSYVDSDVPVDLKASRADRVAKMAQFVADNVPLVTVIRDGVERQEYDNEVMDSFLASLDGDTPETTYGLTSIL